jgi:serine/threonine-protein kinase RsbW
MPAQLNPDQSQSDSSGIELTNIVVIHEATFAANTQRVRAQVDQAVRAIGKNPVPSEQAHSFEIVLAEHLNNIVEHSYAETEQGTIKLTVISDKQKLRICTFDTGVPLPNLSMPEGSQPDLLVEREDLPEGCFGWFLIRKLTRNLVYLRQNNENCFIMDVR